MPVADGRVEDRAALAHEDKVDLEHDAVPLPPAVVRPVLAVHLDDSNTWKPIESKKLSISTVEGAPLLYSTFEVSARITCTLFSVSVAPAPRGGAGQREQGVARHWTEGDEDAETALEERTCQRSFSLGDA